MSEPLDIKIRIKSTGPGEGPYAAALLCNRFLLGEVPNPGGTREQAEADCDRLADALRACLASFDAETPRPPR